MPRRLIKVENVNSLLEEFYLQPYS